MSLHKEILTEDQARLLPAIAVFKENFGLVGGTAIALQIGHRESIDFDLFPKDPAAAFEPAKLKRRFSREALLDRILVEEKHELTFMTKTGIKVTFYHFEYKLPFTEHFARWVDIPSLLTLAAMKAFALGQRSKWKDYVDLYFILRDFHSLEEIAQKAESLFGTAFNQKLFRQQLAYFEDINYTETIVFRPGYAVSNEEIRRGLVEASLRL